MSDPHFMVDLETWATGRDAVIRAVALIVFDPTAADDDDDLKLLIDCRSVVDEQIEAGRVVDPQTVAWWNRQKKPLSELICLSELIGADSYYAPHTLESMTRKIVDPFLTVPQEQGKIKNAIWTRGNFDLPILEHFLGQAPWGYWNGADVRTLDRFVDKVKPARPHDPMADAIAQVDQVRNMYHRLGLAQTVKITA